MMRKYIAYTIVSLALVLGGCTHDDAANPELPAPDKNTTVPTDNELYVKQGVITVKLTSEAGENFAPVETRSGSISTGIASIDQLNEQLGVTRVERTFRHGGKYEAKMRKHGLHLWYNIYFDRSQPVTRAMTDFSSLKDFEIVEPVLKVERIKTGDITPVSESQAAAMVQTRNSGNAISKVEVPFNDPLLGLQWHYHNEGRLRNSRPGADINLYKAWEIETGKPQVIVAVIDGGLQTDHPDLVANLWVNATEKNGASKADDDNNGYVDDIHGYNFVADNGKITPHDHGTHVGGTVGAVNNNGIGVGGVAGGNGKSNSGVRLMSCQIFQANESTGSDETMADEDRGNVFIYAANNGAVIAQCSWSYSWTGVDQELMASDKAGIDYFIAEAGTDENGVQNGPMLGGVVIVATGNDNVNAIKQPAAYEKVISVSSFRPDYYKAVYSNFGSWVTLSAPGGEGDYEAGTQVLSTMTGSQYGYQEGTSMACPHVSGVAALIVSKCGVDAGGGFTNFTNTQLKDILTGSTNDMIGWYNPSVYLLGKGYVNAHKALAEAGTVPPDRVGDMTAAWSIETATLTWRVTADPEEGKAARYGIVVSEENTFGIDFAQLPASITPIYISTTGKNVGDELTLKLTTLEPEKTYYVSIAGYDAAGNVSLSSTLTGRLAENQAPDLVDGLPVISVRKTDATPRQYQLKVADPEGFPWTYTFVPGSAAATMSRNGDILTMTVRGTAVTPASYEAQLTLTDEQGLSRVVTIPYSIIFYAPDQVKEFEDILFQGIESRTYNLADYFTDKDNDAITYSVSSSNPTAISVALNGTTMTVSSLSYGTAAITVTAQDVNAETSVSFNVTCRDVSREVDLYPLPVKKDGVLNIRMGEYVEGNIGVDIYTLSGSRVFSRQVEIASGLPSTIDISSLNTGNYQIVIRYKNNTITRNITKL